jgi:hypothetical protein
MAGCGARPRPTSQAGQQHSSAAVMCTLYPSGLGHQDSSTYSQQPAADRYTIPSSQVQQDSSTDCPSNYSQQPSSTFCPNTSRQQHSSEHSQKLSLISGANSFKDSQQLRSAAQHYCNTLPQKRVTCRALPHFHSFTPCCVLLLSSRHDPPDPRSTTT